MTNKQLRRYEMLFRVMKFGAARQDRFPESTRVGEAFAIVTTAVKQLEGRAVAQMLLKREGARARAATRAELQRLLESISRTASIIQANSPELPHAFEMPKKKSAQALLTAARAAAQHLEPVAPQLVEHGLPQTVVADFTAARDAYAEAVGRRGVGKSESAASRKAIETTLDDALAAARRLDVMVANLLSAGRWRSGSAPSCAPAHLSTSRPPRRRFRLSWTTRKALRAKVRRVPKVPRVPGMPHVLPRHLALLCQVQ
jgi:hypothetical protein